MTAAPPSNGDWQPPAGIVLASSSTYRRALLERAGISFDWKAPHCDESAFLRERPSIAPRALAEELARRKAASLTGEFPSSTIIGCDQIASIDGQILGKPLTAERAIEQLLLLSGRAHQLLTAMVVLHRTQVIRHTDVTTLSMRPLSHDAIERYIRADSPLDCAGSYKLESRGITLFDRIDSADHTAIIGLPIIALTTILRDLGHQIP